MNISLYFATVRVASQKATKGRGTRTVTLLATLMILLVIFATLGSSPALAQISRTIERVSVNSAGVQGDLISQEASISADTGRYVAFESRATNFVDPDPTDQGPDVYLHDRETGETTLISDIDAINAFTDITYIVPLDSPAMSPSISADGRYIAHTAWVESHYETLPDEYRDVKAIFLVDRQTGGVTHVTVKDRHNSPLNMTEGPNGSSYHPSVASGGHVVFASDATVVDHMSRDDNGHRDIFDFFLVSLNEETAQQANNDSDNPSISADSRYAVFQSAASNLVDGDANGQIDIFRVDLQDFSNQWLFGTVPPSIRWGRATDLVSVSSAGDPQANNTSHSPVVSEDGSVVAFVSDATNLVSGDTNGWADIFVRDMETEVTTRVSVASNGNQATSGHSWAPAISPDGNYVAFVSATTNLVAGDTNGMYDIFVHDRSTGETIRVSVSSGGAQANGHSYFPSIAGYGHRVHVAFESEADNLVPGDTNSATDVFVSTMIFRTIGVLMTCTPSSGSLPFSTTMSATLINHYTGLTRKFAGRIDVTTALNHHYYNWRKGHTNIAAGDSFVTSWNQNIPALDSLDGVNTFTLVGQDVTPSPYNQPPYPPSGDTDTNICLLTGELPVPPE